MRKPLTLKKGRRYLIAHCPNCGKIVDAIPDPGAKRSKRGEANWVVSCADCGSSTLDLNSIEPETWFGTGSQL